MAELVDALDLKSSGHLTVRVQVPLRVPLTFLMDYYVYVLQSERDGSYYRGQTRNLEARIKQHNQGKVKYTKGHMPWKLVYSEKFSTRAEALERERYFKTASGRRYLKKILEDI